MRPVIIEAAISGSSRCTNPNVPRSRAELAENAIACIAAGAAIVHNHLEDYSLCGTQAAQAYGAIWHPVLDQYPAVILIPTLVQSRTADPMDGYGHIEGAVRDGAGLAPFDPGSVNFTAGTSDGQPDPVRSASFVNDYATLDRVLNVYASLGIPSSISIWDPTFLRAAMAYERAGRFVPGSFLKLFFGGDRSYLDGNPGVSFGLPPVVEALDLYLAMMEVSSLPWAAAVLGGDILSSSEFAEAVIERGGHLRVGLEDYAGDASPTNSDLVALAALLVRKLGHEPATAQQARELLGLADPVRDPDRR